MNPENTVEKRNTRQQNSGKLRISGYIPNDQIFDRKQRSKSSLKNYLVVVVVVLVAVQYFLN